jgi:hypothetical protein
MVILGDIVSGFGIALFGIGSAYWLWLLSPPGRIAKLRIHSRWHLLGNLSVVGLVVFVMGRTLAGRR